MDRLNLDDLLGKKISDPVNESFENYTSSYQNQLLASLTESMREIGKDANKLKLTNIPYEIKGTLDITQFYLALLANGTQTYENLARSREFDFQTRRNYNDTSKSLKEIVRAMFAEIYNRDIKDIDDKSLNLTLSLYNGAFNGLTSSYTLSLLNQYMKNGGDISRIGDVIELGTKMAGVYNQAILGYAIGLYQKIISDGWLGPKGAAVVVARAFNQLGNYLYKDIFSKSIEDLYKKYVISSAQGQSQQQGGQQQAPQGQQTPQQPQAQGQQAQKGGQGNQQQGQTS